MVIVEGVPDFEFDDDLELAGSPFGLTPTTYAYVEGYDDEIFWGQQFDLFELKDIKVTAISHTQGANGKNAVLKALEDGKIVLGEYGLVCIDSDYDNFEDKNQELYLNDFCFQTYAYSIENYYFQPEGILEQCCISAVNREQAGLPCLIQLVEEWSKSYFDTFGTLLLANNKQEIKGLINNLVPFSITENSDKNILSDDAKRRFSDIGLDENNMFLFYRGHNFQAQMLVLAKQLVKELTEKKKDKILAAHPTDGAKSGKFIKEYMGKQTKIEDRLCFRSPLPRSACYDKLLNDIEIYKGTYCS